MFRIERREFDRQRWISLSGRLDRESVIEARRLVGVEDPAVGIDAGELRFIDESGIGLLAEWVTEGRKLLRLSPYAGMRLDDRLRGGPESR
ncbi:MAG: hypothetical protein AB7G12_11940 [Thermoanaerobaculia bacterium]